METDFQITVRGGIHEESQFVLHDVERGVDDVERLGGDAALEIDQSAPRLEDLAARRGWRDRRRGKR